MSGRTWALGVAVVAGLCACSAARNKTQTDWAFRGLAGEVQQVISRVYYPAAAAGGASSGTEEAGLAVYTISVFARDGRMVEEKFYNPRNELTGYALFKRDRSGRIVEEQSWTAAGKLEQRVAYRYDDRGRRGGEVFYDGEGTRTGAYTYEYDAQGRLKRRLMDTAYSDGSRRSNEVLHSYDAAGRLIEESYHEEALGGLVLRVEHTYQGDRRVYSSHYQRGRWLEFRSFCSYDHAGNEVREASFQIPEDEDSTCYESMSREEQFPRRLLSSRTVREYKYFPGESP